LLYDFVECYDILANKF